MTAPCTLPYQATGRVSDGSVTVRMTEVGGRPLFKIGAFTKIESMTRIVKGARRGITFLSSLGTVADDPHDEERWSEITHWPGFQGLGNGWSL